MTAPSCIIDNALIVAGGSAAPFFGWVEVRDGLIAATGQGPAPASGDAQVIDAGGGALLPGFVNTHAHSHSSLTRGSAEGLALDDWLRTIEREQSRLTEDEARVGVLATYAEALLSGTTSIVDMCLHPRAAVEAAREIGIRAVIAPYVADGKAFTPTLADTAALMDATARDDRVRVWVGLHDLESCSDRQIAEGAALAAARGTGLHLHCSETAHAVERTRARTGRTPPAQLAALGALGGRTLLAHCVWVDEADRELIASAGASVAHCPHANLKLGSGMAPVRDLCRRGVNVTLATDGAKANNRLDLFDVMKFASLLPKGTELDPAARPAPEVLAMASERGARALGIDAGVIAPGRAADLALVRPDALHLQPLVPSTVQTNLVHSARGADVAMMMVAGRILVRDGRLLVLDQDRLVSRLREVGLGLMGEAG
jgi:5-methylthioadenosine/S-adenosylhomocysteine deaminase